ncbi:MAG: hypothetical protein JWM34_2926 [Ilumatobacteraceae bacterium]|nr:hypothetical protein [Ilumatobacteraceae bacterium]
MPTGPRLEGLRRLPIVPLLSVAAALAVVLGASMSVASAESATTPTTPVAGPAAATAVAVRVAPPVRTTPATTPGTTPAAGSTDGSSSCPTTGHAAVIDRANQRAWLCSDGTAAAKFPITTAVSQPKPGTYHVYAKDKVATSTFGGHFSYLDNFVAFTYGTNTGARIAFHAVPRNAAGAPFQPLDTVGTPAYFGASSGCIRVLPDQSQVIWDFLAIGDAVKVIS